MSETFQGVPTRDNLFTSQEAGNIVLIFNNTLYFLTVVKVPNICNLNLSIKVSSTFLKYFISPVKESK